MKPFYWIFGAAMALDLIVLPWLVGGVAIIKLTLAVLPFIFLFSASGRQLISVFIIALAYFRLTSQFNLGILFLSLLIFLAFERWFLVNFFHKNAWQTMVFSGCGVIIFYIFMLGASRVFAPDSFFFDSSLALSAVLTSAAAIGINFLLGRIFLKNLPG